MQQCHLKTYCSDLPNFIISTFVRFYQLYLYHLGQKIHWCIIMVTKCFLTIRSTDRILQWLCSCNLVSWETVSCIYLDSSFLFKFKMCYYGTLEIDASFLFMACDTTDSKMPPQPACTGCGDIWQYVASQTTWQKKWYHFPQYINTYLHVFENCCTNWSTSDI